MFSAQTAIFRSLIESIWEIDSDTVAGWMRGKTRDIPEKIDDFQNEHYKVLFELMFGDCGHIYFYITKEDLAARRFDRIWLVLQCY